MALDGSWAHTVLGTGSHRVQRAHLMWGRRRQDPKHIYFLSLSLLLCFWSCICMPAKSLQSCPILCNPMDCNLPGSSVLGNSPCKNTGVGCHFLLQGNLPDSGIETTSFMSPELPGGFFTTSTTWKAPIIYIKYTDRNVCLTPSLTLLAQVIHRKGWSCLPQNSICACPGL